ncbi:MAG: peptidoglycan editing factor PgeF [Phaeodactylibacter sp.]|nr:peptidoglycan editing factor PgeF [Phaeodactylibacter sp.]
MLFRSPSIFDRFEGLAAAESTRHGGVSTAPYATLNLGINTGDEQAQVAENRRRFFHALGLSDSQLAFSYQVHDDKVLLAEKPGRHEGYDAIITRRKGLVVGVTIADCTPILIYDALNHAVAAIHAGWKGTAKQVVAAALHAMARHFGTKADDCYAYIGTCIDGHNYEVDEKVARFFTAEHKWAGRAPGKWQLDLKSANKAQLLAFGIPEGQIEVSPYSTFADNEHYFSHRREEGTTGRLLAVIGLRA